MSNLETHFYDGKLKDCILPYRTKLEQIAGISIEDKIVVLESLALKLTNPIAKNMLEVIKKDGTNSSNYDGSNDLWAIDVLVLIIEYMNQSESNHVDTLPILQEQLADIANGSCPPGRTTRIFQTIFSCMDSKNDSNIHII